MVNFYNDYVTCSRTAKLSDVAGELLFPTVTITVNLVKYLHLSCFWNTLVFFHLFFPFTAFIVDHFDHIKKVGGAGIVGFGGDYDGVIRWVQWTHIWWQSLLLFLAHTCTGTRINSPLKLNGIVLRLVMELVVRFPALPFTCQHVLGQDAESINQLI